MNTIEKQIKELDFNTPEEYYDRFVKKRYLPRITIEDYTEGTIIERTKEAEKGTLDLSEYYKVVVKDSKTNKKYDVNKLLRQEIMTWQLETPTERKMTPLDYVQRQKWRLDGHVFEFNMDRGLERPIIRLIAPNQPHNKPIKPSLKFKVVLEWI